MEITQAELARQLKLSPRSVSKALAGKPGVSVETVSRVREAARKLGYRRSQRQTGSIGIITVSIVHPYHADLAREIQDQIAKSRASTRLLTLAAEGNPSLEASLIHELDSARVDGIIMLSPRIALPNLVPLLRTDRPIVAINNPTLSPALARRDGLVSITTDNRASSEYLVRMLIEHGHRRIAYLGGPRGSYSNGERFESYKAALNEPHYFNEKYVCMALSRHSTLSEGYDNATKLLTLDPRPTAIVAYNDLFAIGAIRAAADLGLEIPKDLSITGFDDLEITNFTVPRLTSVNDSRRTLAELALQALFEVLDPRLYEAWTDVVSIGTRVVPRDSTGAVPSDIKAVK